MEYNNEFNQGAPMETPMAAPVILKEKKQHGGGKGLLYLILILLALGVLFWFGYTKGWFKSFMKKDGMMDKEKVMQVESNGGNGQELAKVDAWKIDTRETFPVEKTLILNGMTPDSCTSIGQISQEREGNTFYINMPVVRNGVDCGVGVAFEEAIELDILGLPAGVYVVNVNGQQITFQLDIDNMINFDAGSSK